ncbi:tetratricopeptide repeat-containing diguanylate cyclase [Fusobacterium sp.]|uniref:tetratricopeptide repeat-containing diguanylate cyclase n=1 Tax=Fusobacterium sp. TaxID=68766 RepID=UPI00262EF38D|nr:tetratricopeptide repeat-containing diguanylate cyclase [Fusobacterium sp.]
MRKKFFITFISIIFICFFAYDFSFTYSKNKILNSNVYRITKEYLSKGDLKSNYNLLSENEKNYLEALKYYKENNFEKASDLLMQIKNNATNDTLLFYTNFYLNQCEKRLNEYGNFDYIEDAFNIMAKYPVLSNETDLIWQMTSSVITDTNSKKKIIVLLNNFLEKAKGLELENRLKIKGFIAMIKMSSEEYGESIYAYYDILSQAKKIKNPEVRSKIEVKSYEYLGNMYFILDDFSTAIKYYNLAISIPIKNLSENAISKYGSYVNRSESYIQLKDYKKARESSLETEKIIPYLPETLSTGVKIFRYKNLLLLESRNNNFEKANEYYNLCLQLLKEDRGGAFINSKMYVELAYCEMLILQKNYEKAQKKLNILLKQDLEEEWGFDTSIYLLLLKIYKETDQTENFFVTGKKLYQAEKVFNDTLKKDYIEFVKNSYILDQLKKQEKISRIKILTLGGLTFIGIISIFFGLIKIKNLNNKNFIDSLSQVYNRKYLDFLMKKPLKNPLSSIIIMLDIDYFKYYNDFYGHPAGDLVIQKVAKILKNSLRKEDIIIRYGGEEFLIILKDANIDIFKEIYNRISKNLYDEYIPHEKSLISDRITLSAGATFTYFEKNFDLKPPIKKADEALYISKKEGRNKYTII